MQLLSKFRRLASSVTLGLCSLMMLSAFTTRVAAHDAYKSTGFVNDYAGVLDDTTQMAIESDLSEFKRNTSNEIAVLTVNDLAGEDIAVFSNDIFREWGVGDKTKNNGVLLVVAVGDRKARIEVGYGLEGAIPDALAGRIVSNEMTPLFKQANYSGGILAGIRALKIAAQAEYNEPAAANSTSGMSGSYFNILIYGFVVLAWASSFLARSKSIWAGGVVGAVFGSIGLFILHGIIWKSFGFVAAVLLGLLLDSIVSRSYARNVSNGGNGGFFGTRGGFWGGGSGGGSGGGFGGFSGGSSGGGGASGSW